MSVYWKPALLSALVALSLALPAQASQTASQHANPEAASNVMQRDRLVTQKSMVVTAHPLASRAGLRMLDQGGSAVDAAIAAQLVLGLVEPQSSGIGGGGFVLLFQPESGLTSYDGRETVPAASPPDRFELDGQTLSFKQAVNSGRSVGVPGLLRALELMHKDGGVLPWASLFEPAIELAEDGFEVSPRLHTLIADNPELADKAAARAYFLDGQGRPWPVGHRLRNKEYAQVLRLLASQGAQAFYQGELAQDMVAAVAADPIAGDLTVSDLTQYRALRREPLCMDWQQVALCGMAPPSSGAISVMQMLGILQHTPIADVKPQSVEAIHYFSEAGRLAFADRDAWVADPAFVSVPQQALLAPAYLKSRAALIQPGRSMGHAQPGKPLADAQAATDNTPELPSTTHLSVADAKGQVVSMTTSVESAFGSKIMVRGFLLNNQLTDFALNPKDEMGRLSVNRVEPGKRPRSSMAPMMVMQDGRPVIALGSPGGSAIIPYVAQALTGMLMWNLDAQEAVSLPHYGSRNWATELEAGTAVTEQSQALRAMGHEVREQPFPSGTHVIRWTQEGLEAGVDPRREGLALGQ
ncbi:gamma-glutamyltransferase [Alcaligenes ammonioxydans]|uniref:gamma-glutamyltransferase n=1 Tax=Alcaligenes TaxID=507 RepID=UPI000269E5B1|nr:gamma-glutamyltransferase [Alcaligenes ammonioxydans]EJC61710.1 gamma-glutamyltranspeptidase [Alcaligenes faecalis subsp. faecalis NCIB 8687]MCH1879332.1 gamma-glutamyltransferase [Alcaligenes ammonioxydans]